MSRPALLLTVFSLVYVALLILFFSAAAEGNSGIIWTAWNLSGALVLSSTALELALLLFWLYRKGNGALADEPYVPKTITAEELAELDEKAPQVAMLMPAHREVTTPEDAEAFTDRATELICRTPDYCALFLLFDSPEEQHANELAVVKAIKSRLRERGHDTGRVRMETYRQKPAGLRNKPGSIHMWLERFADTFEYMFVLDADSSLAEEDPTRPETCDVLARLVLAMERYPELAMIQARIAVYTAPTLWGWVQNIGCRMASRYHGRLFQWLLEGGVPSYGHNLLFRTEDFAAHVKNTLEYLSHDFLDAADLATAGRKCIHTHAAVTCEEVESSLLGYVTRDLRWARGNAQWANYWFTKPNLPLGPRIYLAVGILAYVWPLLANIFFVTSVLLVGSGTLLFSGSQELALELLFYCVATALLLPKVLASKTLIDFYGSVVIGLLISPAVTMVQGILYLLGAFGTKWTMRGSRSAKLDLDHILGIVRLFLPMSLLALALWLVFLGPMEEATFGAILIRFHLVLLVLSPLLAVILSCPLPEALQEKLAGELADQSPEYRVSFGQLLARRVASVLPFQFADSNSN